jgi:hypothetical protein
LNDGENQRGKLSSSSITTPAPALAVDYKTPHKLSTDEVVTVLEFEIQPKRDIIDKDGQGFTFTAKRLPAAVVTQLFSYMIGKGIQYCYIYTRETFVFPHIPEDPAIVYFSVHMPNLDVMDDAVRPPRRPLHLSSRPSARDRHPSRGMTKPLDK